MWVDALGNSRATGPGRLTGWSEGVLLTPVGKRCVVGCAGGQPWYGTTDARRICRRHPHSAAASASRRRCCCCCRRRAPWPSASLATQSGCNPDFPTLSNGMDSKLAGHFEIRAQLLTNGNGKAASDDNKTTRSNRLTAIRAHVIAALLHGRKRSGADPQAHPLFSCWFSAAALGRWTRGQELRLSRSIADIAQAVAMRHQT